MSSERRLHPLTVLVDVGSAIRQFAVPLVLIIFVRWSREGDDNLVVPLIALLIAAVVALARYVSFRYSYGENELVIRSGILVRNERHIPYDRIQNIDAVQNVAHRLLGVVVVQVQTGAGATPEASLSVLPMSALEEMRERVFARRVVPDASTVDGAEAQGAATAYPAGGKPAALPMRPSAGGRTLLHLPTSELVISGFIENRGMVIILGAIGFLSQVDQIADLAADRLAAWIPGVARTDFSASSLADGSVAIALVVGIATLLLFIRLMSTVWAAVRLHDFTLTRVGEDLRVEYGLLTRVVATIPMKRIQTIAVHETLLHRWLDRAAVRVTTAGGGMGAAGGAEREWLAPIMRRDGLARLLDELQPGLEIERVDWRRAHPRAFRRVALQSIFAGAIITGLAAAFIGWWAAPIAAILLVRALVRARVFVKHLGWGETRDGVVFRAGWLRRTTTVARFSRVQVVEMDESPLDRRASMAHVSVDTAAAGLRMPYLARADAMELRELVTARTAATAFTW